MSVFFADDIYLANSEPAASALSKRRFQAVTILWSLYFAYWTIYYSSLVDSTNLLVPGQENQSLKLTWRDETLYWMPHNAYISTFGLVQNGCKIMLQNMTTRVDNHSLVVTFPSLSSVTTLATGYFFDISNCSEESCPSKWLLEINAQQLMKWQRIGASTWRFDSASASTLFFPDIPFIQKLTSGSEVIIDYQKDWKWYIQFLGVNSVCALGWIAISLSALSKRERSAVWYWVIYLKILAIVSLSLAISNLTEGDWRNGVVDFCWIFPVFILSVGVAFFQKLLIYHLLMYGALLILCKTIEGTLFPISDSNLLLNVLESTGFAVVALVLVLEDAHLKVEHHVAHLVVRRSPRRPRL